MIVISLEPLRGEGMVECSVLKAMVQPLRQEVITRIRGFYPDTRSALLMSADSD